MTRRTFVGTAAAASLFAPAVAAASNNMYIQLQYVMLRNGTQPERANAFFPKHFAAAAQRAGASVVGMFNAVIAPQSPFFLILQAFPSFEAVETARGKLVADAEFQKAADEYNKGAEPPYVRIESSILKTFDVLPSVKASEGATGCSARIFELRTYESNNFHTLRRKIKMFNDGEAGIFQRLGMAPVFFGETIAGKNQPSLTYMLSMRTLAAREHSGPSSEPIPDGRSKKRLPACRTPRSYPTSCNVILRPYRQLPDPVGNIQTKQVL